MTPSSPQVGRPSSERSCLRTCLGVIVVVGVLTALGLWYLISPRRDLEKALAVNWLPWSMRVSDLVVDGWQDYSVRGYFDIEPADIDKLLSARPYEREELHITSGYEGPNSQTHGHKPTLSYSWVSTDGKTICDIMTDESRQWAYFEYGWSQN